MFPFNITNPGIFIEGLLTSQEANLVTNLAGLTPNDGDTFIYDTGTGLWTVGPGGGGGGSGDVVGPASSTDNSIVRFDGTTGKLIKNYTSGAPTVSDTGEVNIPLTSGNSLVVDTTTLVVDATNNRVGIGTASPSDTLTVSGGNIKITSANTTGTGFIVHNTSSGGNNWSIDTPGSSNNPGPLNFYNATVNKTPYTWGSGGTVRMISGGLLAFTSDANYATNGSTDTAISRSSAGVLAVGTNGTSGNTGGTILASKVGLGTTIPATALELSFSDANTVITTGNIPALRITNTNTTNNNMSELAFTTNDLSATNLRTSGILGVNTSHTAGAMTGELVFVTRQAGTYAERLRVNGTNITSAVDVIVPDEAYGVGWNGSLEVPTKNALYDKIETLSGGSNVYNDIYIDQAGGTSDTYGVLAGARNGSNVIYTVSQAIYGTGTLKVWKNGQLLTQGSSEDFVETSPAAGTFTMAVAPTASDEITAEYQKIVVNSDSLVVGSSYAPKLYVYLPDYKPQTEVDAFITAEITPKGKFWGVFWENYRFNSDGTTLFVDTTVSGGANLGFSAGNKTRVLNIADNIIVGVAGDVSGGTGAGAMLADGTKRTNAITAIVNHVSTEGFQGVNINFEPIASLSGSVLTNFTTFMVALRAALDAVSPTLILTWAGQISWDSDQPNKEYSSVNYTGESNMAGTNLLSFTLPDIEAMGTDIVEMQAYDQFYDFGFQEFGITSPDQVANAINFAHSRLPKSKYGLIIGTYGVRMNSGADQYGGGLENNNMARSEITSLDSTFYTTATRQNNQYLLKTIDTSVGTATISIATPAVISITAHGLSVGETISFTTTGALPTGLAVNTTYYVIAAGFGANSFRLSATSGGAAINTSGTQSGTHTLQRRTAISAPDQRTIDTYYAICKNREVAYIGFWLCGDYYYPSVR